MGKLDEGKNEGFNMLDKLTYDPVAIDVCGHELIHNNPNAKGKEKLAGPNDEYGNARYVKNDEGVKGVDTSQGENAPQANKPTTASVDPGTDLPTAIQTADPSGISQALRSMMPMLAKVTQSMQNHSGASQKNKTSNALSNALISLSNKYGFFKVISIIELCLAGGGFDLINDQYQNIVKEALANLIMVAIQNGSIDNLPETPPPVLIYGSLTPIPLYDYDSVPNLYIQQYYTQEIDPYPGYIQWLGPNGDYVYSKRKPLQYPYSNANDEIIGDTANLIVLLLTPYIPTKTNNKPDILTPILLNLILEEALSLVSNAGTEKTLGKNSSSNMMNMLSSLIGAAAPLVTNTRSTFLPISNLNQGAVNKTLQKYSENMAVIKKIQQQANGAFKPPSSLSSLQSMANISSTISSLGVSSTMVTNISKSIGVSLNG